MKQKREEFDLSFLQEELQPRESEAQTVTTKWAKHEVRSGGGYWALGGGKGRGGTGGSGRS